MANKKELNEAAISSTGAIKRLFRDCTI